MGAGGLLGIIQILKILAQGHIGYSGEGVAKLLKVQRSVFVHQIQNCLTPQVNVFCHVIAPICLNFTYI